MTKHKTRLKLKKKWSCVYLSSYILTVYKHGDYYYSKFLIRLLKHCEVVNDGWWSRWGLVGTEELNSSSTLLYLYKPQEFIE